MSSSAEDTRNKTWHTVIGRRHYLAICVVSHAILNGILLYLTFCTVGFSDTEFENAREEYLAAGKIHQIGIAAAFVYCIAFLNHERWKKALMPSGTKEAWYTTVMKWLVCFLFFVWMLSVGLGVTSEITQADASWAKGSLYFFPVIYACYAVWGVLGVLSREPRA